MRQELTRILSLNRMINQYKADRDFKNYETYVLKLRRLELSDGVNAGAYRIKEI